MEPFLGEIKMVGFNFAPRGYAMCQGQLMPIAQNTALFSLLGTMYGGNGQTTFGLPDMRGRIPLHQGQGLGGLAGAHVVRRLRQPAGFRDGGRILALGRAAHGERHQAEGPEPRGASHRRRLPTRGPRVPVPVDVLRPSRRRPILC